MNGAKVLILMTSPLDKIVHSLRVVESIKRSLPELEITWVVRRVYEPLVAAFDFVDDTIVFRRSGSLGKAMGLVRRIRANYYDFVLDFEGHARTGAMCFFARGGRKIGLKSAREGATVCYSEVVARAAKQREHLIEQLLDFGSVFGLKVAVGDVLGQSFCEKLPAKWVHAGEAGRRRVCLFPGRFKADRAWPGMVSLARRLVEEHADVSVFLLGIVPYVVGDALPARVYNLLEKLDWVTICAMVQEADLLVANDNGPAQLAGALGCRNLTLYSYVSPERRGSYPVSDSGNAALLAPGGDMGRLELGTVFEAVEKLLAL